MSWILDGCPRISAGSPDAAIRCDESAIAADGFRARRHAAG
jgi:hypothetical protein